MSILGERAAVDWKEPSSRFDDVVPPTASVELFLYRPESR